MRRRLVALATLLALTGCSMGAAPRNTAGQVTASTSVDAFQLRVGDCTGSLSEGSVADLEIIPCAESHYYEAYDKTDLTDPDFPGESEVAKKANSYCAAKFKSFVGVATKDSKYSMFYLYPTADSWGNGDREVICLAGSDKGKIKGSLKGLKK